MKIIKYIGLGLAALALCSVQAALITWDTPVNITGDAADVSLNGTLFAAYSGSPFVVTLNGVTFDGSIPGFANSSTQPRFAQGLATGDYYNLMNTVGSPNANSGTISLSGLTIGQQYEVQLWAADNNYGPANTLKRTLTTGANSVDLFTEVVAGTGSGQYVIGTFSADSATQDIAVASQDWALINAMQVRVIPEPSTLALFAISGLAVCLSRKKSWFRKK